MATNRSAPAVSTCLWKQLALWEPHGGIRRGVEGGGATAMVTGKWWCIPVISFKLTPLQDRSVLSSLSSLDRDQSWSSTSCQYVAMVRKGARQCFPSKFHKHFDLLRARCSWYWFRFDSWLHKAALISYRHNTLIWMDVYGWITSSSLISESY